MKVYNTTDSTEIEELTSLVKKFHRDFVEESSDTKSFARRKEQREKSRDTKMKLS